MVYWLNIGSRDGVLTADGILTGNRQEIWHCDWTWHRCVLTENGSRDGVWIGHGQKRCYCDPTWAAEVEF